MKTYFQFLTRVLAIATVSLCMSGLLTSCKTVKGFGRDVEKLGSKIEQKADENTHY